METRLCKDCVNYSAQDTVNKDLCTHERSIAPDSLIRGPITFQTCSIMRGSWCGKEGAFYVVPTEKEKADAHAQDNQNGGTDGNAAGDDGGNTLDSARF